MKTTLARLFLSYIRFLARIQLKKNNAVIIGITGSSGKTSTRLAVTKILKTKGKVKHSHKANSETGIPLNILGITVYRYSLIDWLGIAVLAPLKLLTNWEKFDYYVVEMGVDSPKSPKNMSHLLTIIKPHIGVLLNAGLVHGENYDHLVKVKSQKLRNKKIRELIAYEKGKLITSMDSPMNVAIVNSDQPEFKSLMKETPARTITFGKNKASKVRFSEIVSTARTFSMNLTYNGTTHKFAINEANFEDNYAYTFACAIAVGVSLGIPPQKSIKALETYKSPPGRWTILEGIKGTTIIDSSYNASPQTMESALNDLKSIAGRKHKIAVLGDMRELGKESKQAHKDLAVWASKNSNKIFLFGPMTRKYTLPILQRKKKKVHHYEYIDDLVKDLKENLKNEAFILVKGSQNTILLERVVESLLRKKSDIKNLARRGKYWDKVRSLTP